MHKRHLTKNMIKSVFILYKSASVININAGIKKCLKPADSFLKVLHIIQSYKMILWSEIKLYEKKKLTQNIHLLMWRIICW